MILLFLGLLVLGFAGYAVFASLWIRYIFAHIGGLGIIGLFGCWAGTIAKKKGHNYWKAFFVGLMAPSILGIISVGVVYALGGHGCGGIVSLFIAIVVILFYSLSKKRVALIVGFFFLAAASMFPQQKDTLKLTGPYLGQKPPGTTPEIFAPDILPSSNYHTTPTFMPDGGEAYWKMQETNTISMMKIVDGIWTVPAEVTLSSGLKDFRDPFLSPDGKRMFFLSKGKLAYQSEEKENIWYVERKADGWSEPQPLNEGINFHKLHWRVSVASNGNLYFTSRMSGIEDIYYSAYRDGEYQKPERLGGVINTEEMCETTPYISRDESYLIFSRYDLKDKSGQIQSYISFRTKSGLWDTPRKFEHLGYCLCPQITSDGKYFFFIGIKNREFVIKWVSAKIIEELRPKERR